MFLILMVIGLVGLFMMAIPAFRGHGNAPPTHMLGHHADPTASALAAASDHAQADLGDDGSDAADATRFLPSPRAIFSLLALYGAFGNALIQVTHLSFLAASLIAAVPALAVERFAVMPLWNALLRAQGKPSSPLGEMLFCEAKALTPFRNGRGLVALVRDGRHIQLAARLRDDQASLEVRVGDVLRVEDVDAERERLTVSLRRD